MFFFRAGRAAATLVLFPLLLAARDTGYEAQDAISRENRPRDGSYVADSVDAGTGAFLLERTAMSVQGGREMSFDLRYNSLLNRTPGALGPGWSHNYEAYLTGLADGVITVFWDANRKNSFQYAGQGNPYTPLDIGAKYDTLRRNTNGTWRLTRLDRTIYEFDSGGLLTRVGNEAWQFIEVGRNAEGRITSIREPIANHLVFLHYRPGGSGLLQHLQDAEDRVAYFNYDGNGRISEIYDPVTLGPAYPENAPAVLGDIPDNDPNGLLLRVNVNRTDPIGLLMLDNTSITHPRPADLEVTITSPQGTVVRFTLGSRDSPVDLSNFIVNRFNGENPSGAWQIKIVDRQPGSAGQLANWRMRFTEPANATTFTYNVSNQMTAVVAPDGERVLFNRYDSLGRIVSQDDALETNETATFSYQDRAEGGTTTTYTNRNGERYVLEHDLNYNLLRVTDPLDHTNSYRYDSNGNTTAATDPLGRETSFGYDDDGNLVRVSDPLGYGTQFEFDSDRNLITITDPLKRVTRFEYDNNGNLRRVKDASCLDRGCSGDQKTYNGTSQITGNLMEDGGGIGYGYDDGMLDTSRHPVSGSARMLHDNIGRLIRMTDADGYALRYRYNSASQLIEETDQLGRSKTSEYDARGRLIRQVDERGEDTRYVYDGNDNLIAVIEPPGQTSRFEYDGEDRLIRITDPLGNTMEKVYDAAGRLVGETDGLGNTTRTEYDDADNVIAVYDAEGNVIASTAYDDRDLPLAMKDAFGNETTYQYDAAGRVTRILDPLGRAQVFTYDKLDRVVAATDGLGRQANQTYMNDDVTTELVPARGNGHGFSYDPANRLTRITSPSGFTTRFDYNNRDLVRRIDLPTGRGYEYQYDAAGQVQRVARYGPAGTYNVHYAYDDSGNPTLIEVQPPSQTQRKLDSSRSYDATNRMTSYTGPQGDTLRYVYDAAGRVIQLVYPDNKRVDYGYDEADHLVSVTDWAGRVTTYEYDKNGNITRVAFPNGTVRTMELDPAGRVVRRRDLAADQTSILDYRYSYDAAGQMTVESGGLPTVPYIPQPAIMTYRPGDNRLATYDGQQVSYDDDGNLTLGPLGDDFAEYSYDNAGNLSKAGPWDFEYDAEDQLIAIVSNNQRTRLIVNPQPEVNQVLVKRDPNGDETRYVWGIGLAYEEVNGQIRVYHYDQRGSTVAFTNSAGQVSGTVSYGPFGEIASRTGRSDSLFLFTGLYGVITAPNGLNYMRYRWYSPQMKRFLTEDSLYGEIEEQSTLNRYVYASNNPITQIDPNGQFWHAIAGAVIGAVVAPAVAAIVDVATTGKLGSPQRYIAAAAAGAVAGGCIGATFGAGAAACSGLGLTLGATVGGAAAGALSSVAIDAAEGRSVSGADALQAGLQGAEIGFTIGGVAAGGVGVAGRTAAKTAAREGGKHVVKQAARQGARRAARQGGRAVARGALRNGSRTREASVMLRRASGKGPANLASRVRVQHRVIQPRRVHFRNPVARTRPDRPSSFRFAARRVNQGRIGIKGEHAQIRVYQSAAQRVGRPKPVRLQKQMYVF